MAYTESATIITIPAATTYGSTSLYKFMFLNGSGQAVASAGSSNSVPFGVLYGITSTTNDDNQGVPVAIAGVAKVQMAATTQHAGNFVSASTGGLGIVPTTDHYIAGQIVSGSSGSAGRILSVSLFRGPPTLDD